MINSKFKARNICYYTPGEFVNGGNIEDRVVKIEDGFVHCESGIRIRKCHFDTNVRYNAIIIEY